VALSRGSPRVGVTHHLALWSPDFPRQHSCRRDRLTDSSTIQPSEQHYGQVRISAPFSVTTKVCSN
jgi:hypothetical protein